MPSLAAVTASPDRVSPGVGSRGPRRRALAALAAAVVVPSLVACTPLTPKPVAPDGPVAQGVSSPDVAPPPAPPARVAPPPVAPVEGATPVEPAPAETPAGTAPAADPAAVPPAGWSAGNPLAGDTLYGRNDGAAEAAARLRGSNPGDAALLADMASVPTAIWLGSWLGDVTSTVRQRVDEARATGAVPVFVAYNAPNLDCSGHSASGGAQSAAAYGTWVQAVVAGIGSAEAVVIVEPDTLALLCGDPGARTSMLQAAVRALEANPATHTYLDAGHSHWVDASTMAERLRAAGIDDADGFALNVSNFEGTEDNVAYGSAVSAALGGAHFVVDTSRNGNGPGNDWCNPGGRSLGQETTTQTGHDLVDAFIWVKTPGESDGTCNGGPSAGQFWPEYALALARG